METYGLIYTYNGDNSYSVRFPQNKPVYWEVAKNVPERVPAGCFDVLESAVRGGLSKAKGVEVLGVRYSHATIDRRHALFAVFDLKVPGVA
nr:MAG TPA: hypothetical protein [Caudoviricetes sp.]